MLNWIVAIAWIGWFPGASWLEVASRALDSGHPVEAAAAYQRAINALRRSGASASYIVRVQLTLATAWLDAEEHLRAELVLRQVPTSGTLDDRARLGLHNAWGCLYLKLNRLRDAESELLAARDIVKRLPYSDEDLASVNHNLAAVEMRTGRYEQSYQDEMRAIESWEKTASGRPQLIRAWSSLATVQFLSGRARDASLSLERAICLAERAYGPRHPLLADLLDSDSVVLEKLKRGAEARRARKRASSIRKGAQSRVSPQMTVDVREAVAAKHGSRLIQ